MSIEGGLVFHEGIKGLLKLNIRCGLAYRNRTLIDVHSNRDKIIVGKIRGSHKGVAAPPT